MVAGWLLTSGGDTITGLPRGTSEAIHTFNWKNRRMLDRTRLFFAAILLCVAVLAVGGGVALAQPTDVIVSHCGSVDPDNNSISDDPTEALESLLIIPTSGVIQDLDVQLGMEHSWVGDLRVYLLHFETGSYAVLVDRPGSPASPAGCGSNDLFVVLDDSGAGGPLEDQCGESSDAPFPTSPPNFAPYQPLSAFTGESLGGGWLLSVTDLRPGNSGRLVSWCVRANLGSGEIRCTVSAAPDSGADVCAAASDELIVNPGTTVRICYEIANLGEVGFERLSLNSSLHGDVLVDESIPLAPGETYRVTRVATITDDVVVSGTWHAGIADANLNSDDQIAILIDSDGDGRADVHDQCPGEDDNLDSDNDGVADGCDGCPNDPDKTEPGLCGCGVPETNCGGVDNSNGNSNSNDNANDNSNVNGNENDNSNTNTNANDNSNSSDEDNLNDNVGNDNLNSNGNENSNQNGNANQNSNANNNQNSNVDSGGNNNNGANDNAANGNENSNAGNQNGDGPADSPNVECFPNLNCGDGLCGAGVNFFAAIAAMFLFVARNRRTR